MFPDSQLAHKYLDGLKGIEIGGSAHNPFNLNTLNVDYTADTDTIFKKQEDRLCGRKLPVDIVANGDDLPLENESVDFVISSHAIEHFFDPIKALKEWNRVIKKGGYIFTIAPLLEAVPNEKRPITTLDELLKRHKGDIKEEDILKGIKGEELYKKKYGHWTVFDTNLFREICDYLNYKIIETQEKDDKVGNGFTIIIQKYVEKQK